MICLTRLNGTELWLNPLLIETIEATPDSIVTLTNGHKYVIHETPAEISQLVSEFYLSIGLIGCRDFQKDDGN